MFSYTTTVCDGTLLSWKWLNIYLPVNEFLLLLCFYAQLCLPVFISNPQVLSLLPFWFCSLGREDAQVAVWGAFTCLPGYIHNNQLGTLPREISHFRTARSAQQGNTLTDMISKCLLMFLLNWFLPGKRSTRLTQQPAILMKRLEI